MSRKELICPQCGAVVESYRNPAPRWMRSSTIPNGAWSSWNGAGPPADMPCPAVSSRKEKARNRPPCARPSRKPGLEITLESLLGVYSDPERDPRRHTMSVVYIAHTERPESLRAGDDAAGAAFYPLDALPELAFDHARILEDFKAVLRGERNAADM